MDTPLIAAGEWWGLVGRLHLCGDTAACSVVGCTGCLLLKLLGTVFCGCAHTVYEVGVSRCDCGTCIGDQRQAMLFSARILLRYSSQAWSSASSAEEVAAMVLPPAAPALAQALWHFTWHLHAQACPITPATRLITQEAFAAIY